MVEYALIVAGVTATFLIAAVGLQEVVGQVFGNAVSSVQQDPALDQDPPAADDPVVLQTP